MWMNRAVAIAVAALFLMVAAAPSQGDERAVSKAESTAALIEAARVNDAARISTLLSARTPIDATDDQGRTALLIAVHHNSIEAAAALIAAGADVNRKDRIEDSPYLYAGAEGGLEILRMTLKAGADLSSTNRYGGTALIPAAHHGHVETVKELLATDIDVDHVNRLGWTALLEAVILGDGGPAHTEIVRLLIEAGADVNLADGDGVRPLAHARARAYVEIERLLARAGAMP